MSGRGRIYDNILVERLWRTVKYEEIYLKEYVDGRELMRSLDRFFDYYNNKRPHITLIVPAPVERLRHAGTAVTWDSNESQ